MGTDIITNRLEDYFEGINKPMIISGPCSAESEEQVIATALKLKETGKVDVFRAGVWKPRTRPNGFEGAGDTALPWLQRVKQETGMKITVEVAMPQHVEAALKHDVDMLWVGARTTTNPFMVQEIAESLRGANIPLMVKNPLHPDIALWIGALERFNNTGVKNLIGVHRGFYTHIKNPFRNAPLWEIPIELKRIIPDLPIIVDPSHICGNRELIPYLCQKAMDLEMDGLMIESHHQPSKALTDASQQLTPAAIQQLIEDLVIRKNSRLSSGENLLIDFRNEIDRLDDQMIHILAERLKIVEKIGEYKKNMNLTILQLERWSEVIQDRIKTAKALGLEEEFMEKILKIIHQESITRQNDIMNK